MHGLIMVGKKPKKSHPELIDLPEATLDLIKSRINTGTLLEEDKKIIMVILTSYAWLVRQLQFTKISMLRLRNLFGFSTEKRKNKAQKTESLADEGALAELTGEQETQPQSHNALQGLEKDSPEKK
jgi:hypothetical protein